MTIKILPCINCLLLGRCKAQIFDTTGESVYGEYHKSVTINMLMNECSLLNDYVIIEGHPGETKPIDTDKINGVVDYLVSGVIHEDPV